MSWPLPRLMSVRLHFTASQTYEFTQTKAGTSSSSSEGKKRHHWEELGLSSFSLPRAETP